MIRHANIAIAKVAVKYWNGDPDSITHVGNHASSIFTFKNKDDNLQILRFTDPFFRSLSDTNAELAFVNHLYSENVPVAPALNTSEGLLAFELQTKSGFFICSSIKFAEGIHIDESSQGWNIRFFKEWGRNIALIHASSIRFDTSNSTTVRWEWKNELLFRRAEVLIPPEDTESRRELQEIFSECECLSKSNNDFGLIHADHAPQNFRYAIEANRITAFDFGNCCYHWFISDLAISLSTIRRKPNREEIKEGILNGYSSIRALPRDYEKQIDLFIRLRVLYFYLSRLHMWTNPTEQQKRELLQIRNRVHSKIGWG